MTPSKDIQRYEFVQTIYAGHGPTTLGRVKASPNGGWVEFSDFVAREQELQGRIKELELALWQCAGVAGEDLDGQVTPAALVSPPIEEFALNAVRKLRADEPGNKTCVETEERKPGPENLRDGKDDQ